LREATIYSSIIAKVSIPILHSSAAILKIAEMDYSGANSMFLRVLLNKKYALPYRVVDSVVKHFEKFMNDTRKLPILWHQALLVFVQRYKNDLLPDQKEAIKQVIKQHNHPYFADEVRRELANSQNRGENDTPMQGKILSLVLLV
jgi:essential nuclear protein 1